MKRVSFFFAFFLLLTASACSNKVTSYTGESENWSVSCTVQSNSSVASYEYEIRYLGDNPSVIKKVKTKFMSKNIHSTGKFLLIL